MQQNYFQNNGFVERNPLPPVQCCFLQKSRLSFEDTTTLLPGAAAGKEESVQLPCFKKCSLSVQFSQQFCPRLCTRWFAFFSRKINKWKNRTVLLKCSLQSKLFWTQSLTPHCLLIEKHKPICDFLQYPLKTVRFWSSTRKFAHCPLLSSCSNMEGLEMWKVSYRFQKNQNKTLMTVFIEAKKFVVFIRNIESIRYGNVSCPVENASHSL